MRNPMKPAMKQLVSALVLTFVSTSAFAQASHDLESLGDRRASEKASRLDSRARMGVVQGRTVDRNLRFELGVNYGGVAGGDSYVNTGLGGVQADFHINPKFSIGARYSKAFNSLTAEGESRFRSGQNTQAYSVPQISYPEETVMGVVNWYMMYGKMNFFDLRTVQFDIYSLAGYGQVSTKSIYNSQAATSGTWTAGGGIGFWLSKHFTSRFELRYQNYQDAVYTGSRDLNLIVGSFGIGVLL
jgi:outer membrane beta-barrel protein